MRTAAEMNCIEPGLSIPHPDFYTVKMKTIDVGWGIVPSTSCLVQYRTMQGFGTVLYDTAFVIFPPYRDSAGSRYSAVKLA